MDPTSFDRKVSPRRLPYQALIALFESEAASVHLAASGVVAAVVTDAERYGRRFLRGQNTKLTAAGTPRAVRIAATAADGVEIILHLPLRMIDRRSFASTPAGTVVVIFQANAPTWKIRAEHLAIVSHNLAGRRPRVPVRPTEAVILREEAVA